MNTDATSVVNKVSLSSLKKEIRCEVAAMLDKEPIIDTVSKAGPSEGVTVELRHAQRSIVTHSAVLCCSVLHEQICSNENVLVHDCNGVF